jgi:hypothetical protein
MNKLCARRVAEKPETRDVNTCELTHLTQAIMQKQISAILLSTDTTEDGAHGTAHAG